VLAIQTRQAISEFEAEALPHVQELFRTAIRLLPDHAEATDAVQETCLVAWRMFDRYERGTNCRAWLFRVLLNVIRHQRRKRAKWLIGTNEEPREFEWVAHQPVHDNLTDEAILAALDRLSVQFRAVLVLVDVEERSYKEASEILDVPLGTVMSRVSRARALLRGQLANVARTYGLLTVET